jgi:O-antigen ligase
VALWEINFELIRNHPLFGVGPAGYAPYYMTYHPTSAMSTHNNYFDILAQTGVVGFLAFFWMMGTFLWTGFKVQRGYRRKRNFEEAFSKAILAGGLGAMAAMMLGDWVLPFAYNQTITGFDNAAYTWMFLGAIISLYHIQRGEA